MCNDLEPFDERMSCGLLLNKGTLRRGHRHGEWTNYELDGCHTTNVWVDGKLHGPERRYSSEGRLLQEGEYVDGRRKGWWKTWAKDGRLLCESLWSGRRITKSKVYAWW